MSTATAEPRTKVTFVSRSPDQVLTRRAVRYVANDYGSRVAVTEDEWKSRMEEEGKEYDDTPWKAEFRDHTFSTDHPGLIEWLRGHKNFGVITAPGGFYEESPVVDPVDAVAEPMKRIARASVKSDVDDLVALKDEELAGQNRSTIIEAVDAALTTILEDSESETDAGDPDNGDPPSTSQN
jgi:hypothetical protein